MSKHLRRTVDFCDKWLFLLTLFEIHLYNRCILLFGLEEYMDIFCICFELIAINLFFLFGLHVCYTHKKIYFVISGIVFCLFWLNMYILPLPFPSTIFILGIVLLVFEENIFLKIGWFLIFELLESILANLLVFVFSALSNYDIDILYTWADVVCYSLGCVGCIFMKINRISEKNFLYSMHKKNYVLLVITAFVDFVLSGIVGVFFFHPISIMGQRIIVFLILGVICMSFLILFLYFKLQHYHIALQQTAELNQRALKLEELHYAELQQKNEDLRAFRHDYNHHILAMQELAKQENYNALTNYIQNLSQVKEQTYYLSTNHAVADAIVNYFYERLPEQTQFQLLGKFSKPFLVEDSDLCTILSNLIKNAVEATRIVSNNTERKDSTQTILLEIGSDLEHAQIMIENSSISYSAQELERLNTSKVDGINHGFGLKNVKQVVKKYHGTMDIRCENGIFSVCIFLST